MVELYSYGDAFTWCNNQDGKHRIWEKLDYVSANNIWINVFYSSYMCILECVTSDHSPLLIYIVKEPFSGKRISRYEDLLASSIKVYSWNNSGNQCFIIMLKRLRNRLKEWNRGCVGKLEERADELAKSIQFLQRKEVVKISTEESEALEKSSGIYLRTLKWIEFKWAQKARMQWLINGDGDTRFFHFEIRMRRN